MAWLDQRWMAHHRRGGWLTVNAIQSYVAGLLQGTAAPDFGPCQVYIAPPQADAINQPAIFIWGYRDHEERRTFPRGKAFKKNQYDLYLYLKAEFPAGNPRESFAFPLLIEAVKQVLRVSPIQAFYIY